MGKIKEGSSPPAPRTNKAAQRQRADVQGQVKS